ncbi:MAG: DUF115 domain-containing protein [Alteromonadales bacterium]|nr:DUF115 domain-containing protein [Alteromonadales bacterium]MCP4986867.1 DUF115 domain-containing protein [Colwellia sp.]
MESQEVQLQKMLMQATLFANLDALKVYIPEIYEEFKDYRPESSGVAIDKNNNINLFNNDKFVYDVPLDFAKEQVELFLQNPPMFAYSLDHQEDEDMLFEHAVVLKKLMRKLKSEASETVRRPIDEEQIDFICMIGAGLGYQIEALFNKRSIVNFLLCEPSKDTFYAMLHCIEIKKVIEKCISLGGRFSVRIGGSPAGIVNAVSNLLHQQGHFNLSRFFMYRHYLSDTTEDTLKLFHEIGHRWGAGWGFMEDEIISLTHTLSNIQSGFKVCKKTELINNPIAKKPVFIVANGPSLDASVEYLQKNSENIIIVSCGTALKALLTYNIKPDIHVEMERTASLLSYIEAIEEQQKSSSIKLKDIQIIALNTVYPELLKRFKNPLLLTKLSDAGGKLIQQYDKLNMYAAPDNSNPTVSNTAVALITSLGFEEIYFIGLDFGYKSNKHHHSKESIYYDKDFVYVEELKENKLVEGNFSESVYTIPVFDSSKGNVELLLQEFPLINVYNCCDGAKIKYTTPMPLSDITPLEAIQNKDRLLEQLIGNAFDNKQFSSHSIEESIRQSFTQVKVTIEQLMNLVSMEISTREELSQQFTLQNNLLMRLKVRKEHQVTYWLLQGTFRYFQAYIMTNCYYYDEPVQRKEYISFCLTEFKMHIENLYKELLTSYNKPSKA